MIRFLALSAVLAGALFAIVPDADAQARGARASARPRPAGAARARARSRRVEIPPPLTVAVTPEASRPYHVRVAIDVAREGVAEAVGDLRWVSFEIARGGRGRPLTCSYPSQPTRNDPLHVVRAPSPGTAIVDGVVDLRMYCLGAAFDAVRRGEPITPRYGVRSATATRFVAKDADRRARRTANVVGAPFSLPREGDVAPDAPIAVDVPPVAISATRTIPVRPSITGRRESRLYLRPDLWIFDVRSPAGVVTRCPVPRQRVTPILDFFTRLGRGRRTGSVVDLARVCPAGTFDAPGIYDIVPIVELIYDGGNVGITATTGVFRGRVSFIRVRPRVDVDPTSLVRPEPNATNAL